jgi:hypothetical protein
MDQWVPMTVLFVCSGAFSGVKNVLVSMLCHRIPLLAFAGVKIVGCLKYSVIVCDIVPFLAFAGVKNVGCSVLRK